jgi:hypothetical protein
MSQAGIDLNQANEVLVNVGLQMSHNSTTAVP